MSIVRNIVIIYFCLINSALGQSNYINQYVGAHSFFRNLNVTVNGRTIESLQNQFNILLKVFTRLFN